MPYARIHKVVQSVHEKQASKIMKCVDDLQKQLAKIGATLDAGDGYTLNCDAPSGYVWAANSCFAYAIHCANNSQTWYAEAIHSAMPSLRMGLIKVTETSEINEKRHELGDDNWGAAEEAPAKIPWPSE